MVHPGMSKRGAMGELPKLLKNLEKPVAIA
jgi:hypothetical protein